MSKCHLKRTDIEDIRLRVENNPHLTSLCDWSRKLVPIHQSITFKTKTNRGWLAFSPAKSCSLVFSVGSHCIVRCFPLLWFIVVITLGLVLWLPIETHSRGRSSRRMFCFNDYEYMKIICVICVLGNENERDLRSNEHFLSCSENMY